MTGEPQDARTKRRANHENDPKEHPANAKTNADLSDDEVRVMTMKVRRQVLALGVAIGLTVCGCAKGTYLELRFLGPGLPEVRAIRVDLTLMPPNGGAQTHSVGVVKPGGAITFPASMAFKLDDETGALTVDATALGIGDLPVANASLVTPIMPDTTWTKTLNFGLAASTGDTGGL